MANTKPSRDQLDTLLSSSPWTIALRWLRAVVIIKLQPRTVLTEAGMSGRRVAVLDGGYPAWAARGLPKEIDSVPAEDIEAPGRAAQSPPADVAYKAVLQACPPSRHPAWQTATDVFWPCRLYDIS